MVRRRCRRADARHRLAGGGDPFLSGAGRELTAVDLDESPFGPIPIAGLPFGKDSEEARAIKRLRAKIAAARAKVGPGEYAYVDDSPFGIPPD